MPRCLRTIVLAALASLGAAAQTAPVPSTYQDLYTALHQKLDTFNTTVSAGWNGTKSSVAFGAELDTANANRGVKLLAPGTLDGVFLELTALQNLGVKSVTIGIGFPMLYQPFHQFNGDSQDYQSFLTFYQNVVTEVRRRGLKVVIETGLLFPGVYSAGSNFDLVHYYPTLSSTQLDSARATLAITLLQQLHPDWLALGTEPDVEAQVLQQPAYTASGYALSIANRLTQIRGAGVTGSALLGAGIGTWQNDGQSFLKSLLTTGLDFINLHIYPVNFSFLANDTLTYIDMIKAAGKRVGMGEVWGLKERDSEYSTINVADNPSIFARDPLSFWAPLDQELLDSMVKLAHWKGMDFISPFWSRYLFAYVDYSAVAGFPPDAVTDAAVQAAVDALQGNIYSGTGLYYKSLINSSSPQTVSAASYSTRVALDSIVSIFGTNFATSTVPAKTVPLPTSLGGVSISVTDSAGKKASAPLFFVSAQQINALVPAGLAAGPATWSITTSKHVVVTSPVMMASFAPSIFSANANGLGVAAAYVVITHADKTQTSQFVFHCGAAAGSCTPTPLSLGAATDQATLVLFGTGIRHAGLSSVRLTVGGNTLSPFFAGAAPTFVGLDQVNVTLPKSLAGAGQVNVSLTVSGTVANTVTMNVH